MERLIGGLALGGLLAWSASAQGSLAARVRSAGTRTVAFSTASRAEVCGDGANYIRDGQGGGAVQFYNDYYDGETYVQMPCVHGPVRLTMRVVEGVPSRLRATAGPLPSLADTILDLGTVSTTEAGEYLRSLVRTGDRVGEQALLPLTLVDSIPRWEMLAEAARDSTHLLRYRRRASDLLARGAAGTLGAAGWNDDPDAEQRRVAVRALANRRAGGADPVPDLIAIARANPHPDARAAALRQLGQTADPRAIDLFATVLGLSRH